MGTVKTRRELVAAVTLIAFSLVGLGAGFVSQVLLARVLGPNLFGEYSFAWSFLSLMGTLAAFGVAQLWMERFVDAKHRTREQMRGSAALLAATMTASVLIALGAYVVLMRTEGPGQFLLPLLPLVVLFVGVEVLQARLQLEQRRWFLAISQTTLGALRLSAGLMLLLTAIPAHPAMTLVGSAALVLGFTMLRSAFRLRPSRSHVRSSLERSPLILLLTRTATNAWPFAVLNISYLIYFQIDITVLGLMVGPSETGAYAAAVNILLGFTFTFSVLTQKYLQPRIFRMAVHRPAALISAYRVSTFLAALVGLLSCFGLVAVGPELVITLFGEEYTESAALVQVLSIALPIRLAASIPGVFLLTRGHAKSRAAVQVGAAILNVTGNLILIPYIGSLGAALTTVATELCVLVAYLLMARFRYFRRSIFWPWNSPLTDFSNVLGDSRD